MRPFQPVAKRQPRVFYGWHIVAASFVTNMMVASTFWHGFQVFFLPILKHFGWSRAALSGAFSLRQLEGGIVAPVLGFGVDRFGPRRVITAGGFLLGLGMIALSQTSSLWTFYIFFLVAGIGATGLSHTITWPVVISRWFRRKRGLAMGIATSGPVPSGFPMLLTAWLVVVLGWRTVMLFTGLTIWLVLIPVGLSVRSAPEHYGLLPDGDPPDEIPPLASGGRSSITVTASEVEYTVGQALRDRNFWIVMLFFGALFLSISAFSVHQIPYFESLGLSTSAAAATVTIFYLVSAIGRMGAGWISDRLDIRLVLATVVALNGSAWLYLIAVNVSNLVGALPFTMLFGVSFGATVSLRPLIMALLYGTRALGSINGLLQSGPVLTGLAGPLVMGRIFDVTGEYTQSLYVLAAAAALALPLALLVRSRPSSSEAVRLSPDPSRMR